MKIMYRNLFLTVSAICVVFVVVFGVYVVSQKKVDDFGVAVVSYSKGFPILYLDDPSAEYIAVTAVYLDSDGNPVLLDQKRAKGTMVYMEDWINELREEWWSRGDDEGIGILFVIDALRPGLRLSTMVVAVPLRIPRLLHGEGPNITVVPNYLGERIFEGWPGNWTISNFTLTEANVPLATVLAGERLQSLRVKVSTSSRPPFLGAGILVRWGDGRRYAGLWRAWFTKMHDVMISADETWGRSNGMSLYVSAVVGILELERDSPQQELRIPVFIPEVALRGNTWTVDLIPGLPNGDYVSSILAPTGAANLFLFEDGFWLQNPGKGKVHYGPIVDVGFFLGSPGTEALLVGPLLDLRATVTEGKISPRYYGQEVLVPWGSVEVPYFTVLL